MREKVNRSYKKPDFALICPPTFFRALSPTQVLTHHIDVIGFHDDNIRQKSEDQKKQTFAITQSQWKNRMLQNNISMRITKTRIGTRSLKPKYNNQFRKTLKKSSPYVKDEQKFNRLLQTMKPVTGPTQSIMKQIDKHNQDNRFNAESVILKKKESFNIKISKYSNRIGLRNNEKLFIFNSKDHHIRQMLLKNGWVQSIDKQSAFFHLKWLYLDSPADYDNLKEGQFYNHFRGNQQLTNKNMLKKNIKNWNGDKPKFPLTYDLQMGEQQRQFCRKYQQFYIFKFINQIVHEFKQYNQSYYQRVQRNSYIRRLPFLPQTIDRKFIINLLLPQKLKQQNLINLRSNFYNFCFDFSSLDSERVQRPEVGFKRKQQSLLCSQIQKIKKSSQNYLTQLLYILQVDHFIAVWLFKIKWLICEKYQQCYGVQNSWIIKPTGVSRGSGISIQTDYTKIAANKYGKIVQKYIEKPLLLDCGRKFDIRQWVLVKSFSPLQAYVFQSCYCRFSYQKYDDTNFDNLNRHLTNYTLNKNSYSKVSISTENSILSEFQLQKQLGGDRWSIIKQKMNQQILKTLKCCQYNIEQNSQCFEVYGFDILIDSDYQPWVLQVNMSPACQVRSQFLKQYLAKMAEGIYKLLINQKIQNWIRLSGKQQTVEKHTKSTINNSASLIQNMWKRYKKHHKTKHQSC